MDKDKTDIYDKNFDDILKIVVKKTLGLDELDSDEQKIFIEWYNQDEKNKDFFDSLGKSSKIDELLSLIEIEYADLQFNAVKKRVTAMSKSESKINLIKSISFLQLPFIKEWFQNRFSNYWFYTTASLTVVLLTLFVNHHFFNRHYNKQSFREITSVYILNDSEGQPILVEDESINFMIDKENVQNEKDSAQTSSSFNISNKNKNKNVEANTKTVVVPKGKEINIILPDGSKVWLGANSSISFPEKFLQDTREVIVSGEAFFDIVKVDSRLFVVNSSGVRTKVYGTEFYITSLLDMDYMSVSLISGSVEVENNAGASVVLQPGQRAISYTEQNDFDIENFDIETLKDVKEGMFIFWGSRIKDIAPVLGNWYDFTIICDSEIEDSIFYLKINKETSLEKVLKLLSSTNRLGYKLNSKNKTIILTPIN